MIEYLKDLLFSGSDASRMFNSGFLSGVATAIGVIVILLIIKIIIAIACRRKKCNGITMQGELGNIFVSTSAITAAIRTLECEFDALVIQKIRLIEGKNAKVTICIQMIFDEKGGNFKLYSENFQRRVIAKLRDAFGIDSIDKVDIDNNTFNSDQKSPRSHKESATIVPNSDGVEFLPSSEK